MIRFLTKLAVMLPVIFIAIQGYGQKKYPYAFGYAGATQVGQDQKYSITTGAPFYSKWITNSKGDRVLAGFNPGLTFIGNTFEDQLFASKGYYADYVELKWEVVRYENRINRIRVYRKELGKTNDPYVQVANLSKDDRTWRDEQTESGVLYQYKVLADGVSLVDKPLLNFVEGIGFRIPYGRVSGRVLFDGGGAVQGVTLIAEADDVFTGGSILLNGTDASLEIVTENEPLLQLDTAVTLQGWFLPTGPDGVVETLIEKKDQFHVFHRTGTVTFAVKGTNGLVQAVVNFPEKRDTLFHVTAMLTKDSLKLFVKYDESEEYKDAKLFNDDVTANAHPIYIGKSSPGSATGSAAYFTGYVDEVRIWNKAFYSDREILDLAERFISGTEKNLSAYYRFDEGVGNAVYDISRSGFNFNEFHATYSSDSPIQWKNKVPFRNQLALKGKTDANGNYMISGIPFATDGNLYKIVPSFGVHAFDPKDKMVFVGPGESVHSNINFTDISSFPTTGTIYYVNTEFPVKDVEIKIDGQFALDKNGNIVKTNALGQFTVDVPIGEHYLEFTKNGHVFTKGGRFPEEEGSMFVFSGNYTLPERNIEDSTLIKVVGRVAGGAKEKSKPFGLGQTIANIGVDTITLGTEANRVLTSRVVPNDPKTEYKAVNETIINSFYDNSEELKTTLVPTTKVNIFKSRIRELKFVPDANTGEFVLYLLPEKYKVTAFRNENYTSLIDDFNFTIDLRNAFQRKTSIDTVSLNPLEIDSVHYNYFLEFNYRTDPVISVTDKNGNPVFWEKEIDVDGVSVALNEADGTPKTGGIAIFKQRDLYEAKISVFETYTNGTEQFNVPVTDGKVLIKNALAIDDAELSLDLNNKGEVAYKFKGGKPSITGDDIGASILSITAETVGPKGIIKTPWRTESNLFKGYVLGGIATGSNFVTAGPNKVEMILRDPPGSQSSSFYATGSSTSTNTTISGTSANKVNTELELSLGLDIEFSSGFGVEKTTEIDLTLDETIGMEVETVYGGNNSTISTVTSTQTWSTSSEPDYVGAQGDLFIGYSSNIVYGTAKNIVAVPHTQACQTPRCIKIDDNYALLVRESLRLSPKFGTAFQYTQNHIKNYLIPNLKKLRDLYLTNSKWHDVHSSSPDDFGKSNPKSTETTSYSPDGKTKTVVGDYYRYTLSETAAVGARYYWPSLDSLFEDSIPWYNQQIAGWEATLARNEREKVLSTLEKNLSFDAGVTVTNEVTFENSSSSESTYDFTLSPTVAAAVGLEVDGVGSTVTITQVATTGTSRVDGFDTTTTQTFGYTLQDTDVGDYFSVDVRNPGSGTGAVFSLKGGQSSCPYEDQEVTEFYAPLGKEISAATQQREVPELEVVSSPTLVNVPEDKAANFTVKISNASESDNAFWFVIAIDEQSNQNGALVKFDGAPILNGRSIYVPAGASLNKVISIEKTDPAIFEYPNIGIILRSDCQFDPSDDLPDIADTVSLSASFIPVCSGVELRQPLDKWVVNSNNINGDKKFLLPVQVADYDLTHSGFNNIALEYKPSSSSQWTQITKFFVENDDYDAAIASGQNAEKIDGAALMNYQWDVTDIFDREYDLRAITSCAAGEKNSSSIISGIKDTKRPKIFGTPQPGDGILSPGEDIKIRFDEDIQAGLLLGANFSVRGVLNDTEIGHDASLFFDGADDHATNTGGVKLTDRSFSVEFWTKRASLASGVIFSQGDIEMGFNGNKFYVNLGVQNFEVTQTYGFTDKWIHFTVSFDYENNLIHVYSAYDGSTNDVALADGQVDGTKIINGDGRLTFGASKDADRFYHGYLHDFRIWNKVIGRGTASAEKLSQFKGDEIGLVGLWPMNELSGEIAIDVARAHSVTLKNGTAWKVTPSGFAREFNGSNNLSIPTATSITINNEMDFTIEMWFKGNAQANTVLFANGKADGSEPPAAFEDIWKIGFDDKGKIYFKNNGITVSDPNGNYLDGSWHHLAVVLRRKANATLFVDGLNVGFATSTSFGGLKGASMTIGSTQKYGTYDNFANHFIGAIDEFRVWELARTKKLLELDLNSKLQGDEEGLVAYYPFENFNSILQLEGSLESGIEGATQTATENGAGTFTDINVPLITQARPVQDLNFDWVVNEDEVIINILEPSALIEKQIIELTISGVEDLNENSLASPETWTAFIKQNTVIWDTKSLEFEKLVYDPLNFEVEIVNIGGVEEDFTISNIPAWLSVSEELGSLAPDSRKTISFQIDPAINIGTYEEVLYLTTDFGFNEAFYLTVKVVGEEPDWVLNPSDFQFSMNLVGMIRVDGVVSADEDDMLAAFVGSELRGVSRLSYVEEYDSYMALLDVYSHTPDGDVLSFKIWDASEGKVHVDVTPELNFVADNLIGSPANPQFFDAINIIEYPIPLNKGWNWISFPLKSKNSNDIGKLMGDLDVNNGDLIKSIRFFEQYSSQVGWAGNLKEVNSKELYKMYISNADTIDFSGAKVNTESEVVTISKGWNWLGAPFLHNLSVSNAFANFTPTHGDLIKGQVGFSIYDEKIGWIGTLEFLKPRAGYMFKSAASGLLQFPNAELYKSSSSLSEDEIRALVEAYAVDVNRFQNNMTLVGRLQDSTDAIDEALLVAYAGNDVRGVSHLVQGKFFINLFSSVAGEELTFVIVDHNNTEYQTLQSIDFSSDSIVGSVRNPYEFTVSGIYDGPNQKGLTADNNGIIAFPTVFDDEINVHLSLDEKTEVKAILQDVSGRTLSTLFETAQGAGDHKLKWTHVFGQDNVPQGVLILRIFYNEEPVFQTRLVHIKK